MTPTFQIAARGPDGKAGLLRIQHEDIRTIECALALTRNELPDAKVILVTVPKEGIYARSQNISVVDTEGASNG